MIIPQYDIQDYVMEKYSEQYETDQKTEFITVSQ